MASRRVIQSILVVLIVLCSSTAAQQPSIRPYESEEDLWESLHDGEITFDEFVELLDLARAGDDSLLVPRSDWEALPGSEAGYLVPPDSTHTLTETSVSAPSRIDIPWVTSVRVGVDADLNEPTGSDGYSVIRVRRDDWGGILDFEHDRDDGGSWRRRSLSWQPRNFTFVLGNIEPRWGRGLVVGRRSRVVSTADRSGSFWQPARGRYDGLHAQSRIARNITVEGFFSYMDSDSLGEIAGGMQATFGAREFEFGVAGVSSVNGFIEKSGRSTVVRSYYEELVCGSHLLYLHGRRRLIGEIAVNDIGASAKALEIVWPLSSGKFHARGWSYGKRYINPIGGGPAHNDTRIVELDVDDRTFSSRTAGERGFDFTTRLNVSRAVNLRWDWMSHREAPGATLEHNGVFRAEIKQSDFRTTPFVRAQVDEDDTESFSLGNYLWWGPDNRELNARLEFGRHYNEEVQFIRAGLGAKLQLNRIVRFAPALRWVDPNLDSPSDGYWYFYYTETVIPIGGGRMEVSLIWKKYEDRGNDDLVELRVRGFVR